LPFLFAVNVSFKTPLGALTDELFLLKALPFTSTFHPEISQPFASVPEHTSPNILSLLLPPKKIPATEMQK